MEHGPFLDTDSDLLFYERQTRQQGYLRIAGVDEVGRGPLAGPVVAAAVVFASLDQVPDGLDDSKKLTEARREALFEVLHSLPGVGIGLASASPEEIDELNILRATHVAMRRALGQIDPPADFALVDGLPVSGLPVPSRALVKGDSLSASIAAASIVAKVSRDRLMQKFDTDFPGYGLARNKGYPTPEHMRALHELGPTAIHRKSFAPVAEVLPGAPVQPEFDFASDLATGTT